MNEGEFCPKYREGFNRAILNVIVFFFKTIPQNTLENMIQFNWIC
jgi:hypothetical protein